MAGKDKNYNIWDELFSYAKEVMEEKQIYPYVSFIVKKGVIISRGYNQERETWNLSNQDQVVSIREAQKVLDTDNLKGYSLFSFYEPTLLGFDAALWSGITDFHWCINSTSAKESYNKISYRPTDYQKNNPGKITIEAGIREKEALALSATAKKKRYQI
jgi:tRNA(Arg) A34 adenosine deaminase TadA